MEKPGSEVRCPPGERAHQWAFALRAEFTDPKASLLDSHLERDEGWMSYGLPCEFGDDGEELDRDWQDPWPVSDDVRAEWGRRNTELYAGYCAMDTENDVRSPWKLVDLRPSSLLPPPTSLRLALPYPESPSPP